MLRTTWRWLRRGLTLGMLLLLLVRMVPADPDKPRADTPARLPRANTPIAWPARPAPIFSSTPTIPSTGIPGARKRSPRPRRKASSSSCRSATAPATGATSWSASRSRTRRSPRSSTSDFVCIKVDREERPDIDQVYMTALQVIPPGRAAAGRCRCSSRRTASRSSAAPTGRPRTRKSTASKVRGFKSVLKIIQDAWTGQAEGAARTGGPERRRDAAGAGRAGAAAWRSSSSTAICQRPPWTKSRTASIRKYGGFGSPARGFRGHEVSHAVAASHCSSSEAAAQQVEGPATSWMA